MLTITIETEQTKIIVNPDPIMNYAIVIVKLTGQAFTLTVEQLIKILERIVEG